MSLHVQKVNHPEDLDKVFAIRKIVFVDEQNCPPELEWEHEDEFRLIVNGNSAESGLLPLEIFAPFLKVTGIIIGEQMDVDKRNRVYNLCFDKDMRIYNAFFSD